MKLKMVVDVGQEWLKVPRHMLQNLGLELDISKHSLQKGGFVFLAEAKDRETFIEKCKTSGLDIELEKEIIRGHSEIRTFPTYKVV